MNSFKEFNISIPDKGFTGDKIKMSKILNREIVVHAYKIEDSKVFKDRGTGKCLCIQISINGEMHIVFTGSSLLQEMIKLIPAEGFPFTTTIMQIDERYKFT